MKPTLRGRVAVVAGATRGAGRGIARMLGEAGATVYCAGRSSRAQKVRRRRTPASPFDLASRPETIEETAELVDGHGGRGIPVRVDFTDDRQVQELFARVAHEHGRLDLLVNDIWGGDELTEWGRPFHELALDRGFAMLERAVHTHVRSSRHAAPLMVAARRGLIVEVTDGDALHYRGNLFYDLVKSSVIRLAFALAEELRVHRVAALALTPGFLRSEAMLDHFGVGEANWRDAVDQDPDFAASETPCYVGRAVAALAADRRILARSGRTFSSWGLAAEYGFTDLDGSTPDWGRHLARGCGTATRRIVAEQRRSHRRFVDAFAAPARARPGPRR